MNIIYSLILVIAFALLFQKLIKNYSLIFYFASAVISFGIILLKGFNIDIPKNFITVSLLKGAIPTAMFILVMFIGALNNKWKITKYLNSIRAEIAIMGCIIILGHNISFGFMGKGSYFLNLINGVNAFKPPQRFYAAIVSLILVVIMIPLMITSFKCIRKKMSQKSWNKLHKLSYVFYFLILLHVLVLWIPSYPKHFKDVLIYSIIYVIYFIMKMIKILSKKRIKN